MVIGISGAFCDNNFGDYTMLLNNVYEFISIEKSIEKIIVFCYDAGFVKILARDYFPDVNVEFVEIKTLLERPEQGSFFGIDHTDEAFTPQEILCEIENIEKLRLKVAEIDLMVSNGGGYYDYYWLGLKRRYRLFGIIAPLIIARQAGKKIVTLGNSFGPWGNNKEFFFGLFNYINFDAIDCRDNLYSKKYLNQIGVNENIYEICDDLSSINEKLLSRQNSSIQFSDYYIIDIYPSVQDIEHNIDCIIAFIKNIKSSHNLTPVFVAHGDGYNGERQGELLKRYIPELVIYESDKEYLAPEDFIALLKGAAFVLCEHYHSFVLATVSKIPALMFVRKIDGSYFYSYNKTVGFLKISGVLEKSETGEELFCVLSLPELFDASEKFDRRIKTISRILKGHEFSSLAKELYMKKILNLCAGAKTD